MARRYYDINPTKLFKEPERRNYSEILLSFNNSKNYKIFCDEASTWVVRSINGRVSWRMLPIHAAVATDAPTEVLEVLISACKTCKLLNAVESEKVKTTAEEARKLEALETVKDIEKKVEKIEKEKQELIQEQVDKKLEVSTMEKEIRVLEETNNEILNIVETERNKYGSLNIKNEHLVTSLEKEKKNNNLLFVKERESIEKLNALQEDVAQKERVNKDLLEEIFDKCLENNRLLNEMTVLEKKMDEMQKIVQQEREEHMNLSVKEREASEKIKELQNDAIKIEGLTKDLSGDLYNKCEENTKLQEEVSVLKEKK